MAPALITPSDLGEPSSQEIVPSKSVGGGSGDEKPRPTPLSERVERARDTITETPLYSALKTASEQVGEKLGAVWQFSKKCSWVLGTSALILILPVLWEIDREQVTAGTSPASAPSADAGASSSAGASGSTTASAPAPASTSATTTAPAS